MDEAYKILAVVRFDADGQNVGYDVELANGESFELSFRDTPMWVSGYGQPTNARYESGVFIGVEAPLSVRVKERDSFDRLEIVCRDKEVLIADYITGSVLVVDQTLMPWGLRHLNREVSLSDVDMWVRQRVDNLYRTHMSDVHEVRGVGRNVYAIVRDSGAASVADNFWVWHSDSALTWEKIKTERDTDGMLETTALFGRGVSGQASSREGTTSLFTLKGAYPKAVRAGWLLKQGGHSEYEYVAYVIGRALGISVAEAQVRNPSVSGARMSDGSFAIGAAHIDDAQTAVRLFTSDTVSLAHASEIVYWDGGSLADYQRRFYGLLPLRFKRQLERVFILDFLISNTDVHDQNFGVVYDAATFDILSVAPSFDHNKAVFNGEGLGQGANDIALNGIKYHEGIAVKIKNGVLAAALAELKDWLTPGQKESVLAQGRVLIGG